MLYCRLKLQSIKPGLHKLIKRPKIGVVTKRNTVGTITVNSIGLNN